MIEEIRQYVIDRSEAYRRGSEDHYDFWNEHIRYVYQEAVGLAQIYHADKTVVSLGALLHDIALIEKAGDKKDHHLYGKILSNEILNRFLCPEEIKGTGSGMRTAPQKREKRGKHRRTVRMRRRYPGTL